MSSLEQKDHEQTGKIWAGLSQEQKDEVLLSYEESEDENNLIEVAALFKSANNLGYLKDLP
jgi:hypothetical protein